MEDEKDESSVIQNYLDSFNKEIEDAQDSASEEETFCEIVDDNIEENGTDEDCETCNQSTKMEKLENRKREIKIIKLQVEPNPVPSSSKHFQALNGDSDEVLLDNIKEEIPDDDPETLEMLSNIAEKAVAKDLGDLGNSYQTVTIVPSDTNPGELSYVLFVSDVGDLDRNNDNIDMSVYDFNSAGRYGDTFLSEEISSGPEGVKMCAIRIGNRRAQFVAQQHMCRYCNYTSPKRYLLSRHMKSHSDERPHKCGVCERGFKTLASLQNHVNTHTGTRPHMCRDCDSCFTTSGELVRHTRYKHTHEKPHKCTECDYASVELSKLKRHIRCHTGERPYQCPHCTYASPDTYKLKRHLRIHTGEKPYECDICQSRFTQSNSLKAHKLIHTGKKPVFHCEYCPATCGRKTDLRIHMEKLHSVDVPHRCKRCGKVFLDRYSYKLHVKTHDGEKCYKCDLCDYASVSIRHLEAHMLVHTDQKPFQCIECGQCFRQKQLLKRHHNLYHTPDYIPPAPKEKTNKCSQCDKAFRHMGNLMRHYAVHDPDATMLERESAMRIGEPKEPGEIQDGEEEDFEGEGNDSNDSEPDKQVVVFEVIQLPRSNGGSPNEENLTMGDGRTIMLNGEELKGYSVIEPAQDSGDGFINSQEFASDAEDMENFSTISSFEIDQNIGSSWKKATRNFKKKHQIALDAPKRAYRRRGTARRGRPPKSFSGPSRLCKIIAKKPDLSNVEVTAASTYLEDYSQPLERDLAALAREQNVSRDLEDCFGFDDEPEDDNEFNSGMVEEIC